MGVRDKDAIKRVNKALSAGTEGEDSVRSLRFRV